MYFGRKIFPKPPSPLVKTQQEVRKSQIRFPRNPEPTVKSVVSTRNLEYCSYNGAPVQVGDVVAFDPTGEDKKFWGFTNTQFFAYAQRIEKLRDGNQRLFVLYLYCPHKTNMSKAKYPFENKLFFSDNCNCDEGELLASEINGKREVEWVPPTIPTRRFFVRQTYVTHDSAFVSFQEKHKVCICIKGKTSDADGYRPGETVCITKTVNGQKVLEPVVVRCTDKTSDIVIV